MKIVDGLMLKNSTINEHQVYQYDTALEKEKVELWPTRDPTEKRKESDEEEWSRKQMPW